MLRCGLSFRLDCPKFRRAMTLRLHWSPDSANLPVRIALEMFGFDYEAVRVDRASGKHRSAAYLKLNPQGLIPVLEDGDLVLFETGAILWHLATKAERIGPNGPKITDDEARAAALTWMFYLSNTVHADLRVGFNPQRYVNTGTGTDTLRDGIARRMQEHFDLIETHVYDRVFGQATILPDIYFAVMVRWAQLYPVQNPLIADLSRWPTLQAMCLRVEAHPAAIRAFKAEGIPSDQAVTFPRLPEIPLSEITGL